MQLQISTRELRRQLLHSRYLQDCTDPATATAILQSDFEWADYNCSLIFSREYNRNLCVHFHYLNINTNVQEIAYCHFIMNDTQNFMHLHLFERHFTPYIEVQQIIIENRNNNQQIEYKRVATILQKRSKYNTNKKIIIFCIITAIENY